MRMPKSLGIILLAIWLILFGLLTTTVLNIKFDHQADVLALLGIVAGVVLLVQR